MFLVRFRHYIIGNNGLIIPSLIYLYLGASAERVFKLISSKEDEAVSDVSDYDKNMKRLEMAIMIFGAVVLTTVVCLLGHLTKKELEKMIKEQEEEDKTNQAGRVSD